MRERFSCVFCCGAMCLIVTGLSKARECICSGDAHLMALQLAVVSAARGLLSYQPVTHEAARFLWRYQLDDYLRLPEIIALGLPSGSI